MCTMDQATVTQAGVVASFARYASSKLQSFPRRRESILQTLRNGASKDWIPAFAGMTGVLGGR